MKKSISGIVGKVIEVNSERVIVQVSDSLDNYNIIHNGSLYRVGQVGSFIKIITGLTSLYGVVESFSTFLQSGNITIDKKVIYVSLVGYRTVNGEFERGAKITPSINDMACIIDDSDINLIFKNDIKFPVNIGNNFFASSLPVYINLNEFVLKHSFIVGSTGSGKSNTVAFLLNNIIKDYPSSRVLMIDIHGEYMNYLQKEAKEFSVYDTQTKLTIPYWMLDFDTLCKLFGIPFGNVNSSIADEFRDIIIQMKKEYVGNSDLNAKIKLNDININSPIPFNIKQVWLEFYSRGYGTYNSITHIANDYAYEKDDSGNDLIGDAENLIKPQFKPIRPKCG